MESWQAMSSRTLSRKAIACALLFGVLLGWLCWDEPEPKPPTRAQRALGWLLERPEEPKSKLDRAAEWITEED